MGFRFRKSLPILPGIRLNLSKSGISTSLGVPGATLNLSKRGARGTVGIPGSGLSWSEQFGGSRSSRLVGTTDIASAIPMLTFGCVMLLAIPVAIFFAVVAFLDGAEATPIPEQSAVTFTICHTGGGTNCVVDGDTAWIAGEKVRIADIDAPETHPPRCARESEMGDRATHRLAELLNAGPFSLERIGRDEDRYGRKLRHITRGGVSIGGQLVHEGLARPYGGRRQPWC